MTERPATYEIEYRLGPDDFRALHTHLWDVTYGQSRSLKPGFGQFIMLHIRHQMVVVVVLSVGVIVLIVATGMVRHEIIWKFVLLPMLAVAITLAVLIWCLRSEADTSPKSKWVEQMLRAGLASGQMRPGTCRTGFDATGFTEVLSPSAHAEDGGNERVAWPEVRDIAIADEHVFFAIGCRGYLILPRLAFKDTDEFAQFLEMVRNYRTAAHSP
jgi:hypothetical protein